MAHVSTKAPAARSMSWPAPSRPVSDENARTESTPRRSLAATLAAGGVESNARSCARKDVARMKITSHNAADAPQPAVGHAQVVEVGGATRFAYLSGQVPVTRDGAVPDSFAEQCRLIWRNIEAQLAEVGMTLDNVVKATTFLSDRKYAIENRAFAPRSWARVRGRSPSSFATSSTKRGCLRSRSSRRPEPPSLPRSASRPCAAG